MTVQQCQRCLWWMAPWHLPAEQRLGGVRRGFGLCATHSYTEHGPGVYRQIHEWRSATSSCGNFMGTAPALSDGAESEDRRG